ncbi:hypothetical protein [Jutongia sp.]|uniref:hypothetical protein n=1 Tax=Jutongia sp. TaxID=2944204 RepID=UPI00307A3E7F
MDGCGIFKKYKWNARIVHGTMGSEKFEVDGGKCMSDLYVSDLDGTLLRSNEVTSKYTNQVINSLVKDC